MRSSSAQTRTGTPPNCYKLLQRDGDGTREKGARKTAKENEIETG
jgi:hypothetical protein